jgi:D-alanine-D-alanine ligase
MTPIATPGHTGPDHSMTGTSPVDYQLRDIVTDGDCQAVRDLVTRTGFFHPAEVEIAVELVSERLARGGASGYEFLFAESINLGGSGETLLGYACYGAIACAQGSYDLYWIAVDPQYQRHGIGRRLLAAVEARIVSAGGRQIYIDTSGRSHYTPTRAFYERNGYECAARLAEFYAPGDDRVIYVKDVATAGG